MSFNEPEQVQTAFYRAFQELDIGTMEQVWSSGAECTCIHPGGDLIEGKSAVVQSWAEIFASADPPTLSFRALQITHAGDISIHLVEETIRPGNTPESKASRVLSTNIYCRFADGWKMTAHHASLPLMRPRNKQEPGRLH